MAVVNTGLLKHPMNWLTIVLMLVIGGAAWHLAGNLIKNARQ